MEEITQYRAMIGLFYSSAISHCRKRKVRRLPAQKCVPAHRKGKDKGKKSQVSTGGRNVEERKPHCRFKLYLLLLAVSVTNLIINEEPIEGIVNQTVSSIENRICSLNENQGYSNMTGHQKLAEVEGFVGDLSSNRSLKCRQHCDYENGSSNDSSNPYHINPSYTTAYPQITGYVFVHLNTSICDSISHQLRLNLSISLDSHHVNNTVLCISIGDSINDTVEISDSTTESTSSHFYGHVNDSLLDDVNCSKSESKSWLSGSGRIDEQLHSYCHVVADDICFIEEILNNSQTEEQRSEKLPEETVIRISTLILTVLVSFCFNFLMPVVGLVGFHKQSNKIEEKKKSDVHTADNVEEKRNVKLLKDQKERFGLDAFHYDFPAFMNEHDEDDDWDDDKDFAVEEPIETVHCCVSSQRTLPSYASQHFNAFSVTEHKDAGVQCTEGQKKNSFCNEDAFEGTLEDEDVESNLLINEKKITDVYSIVKKKIVAKDSNATDISVNMPSYESQINRKMFGPGSDVPFLNYKEISSEPVWQIPNDSCSVQGDDNEFRDIHPQLNKATATQKENIDDVHQDERKEPTATTPTDRSSRPTQITMSSEFTTQSSEFSFNSSETSAETFVKTSSFSSSATSAMSGLLFQLSLESHEEALKYEWARFRSFYSFPIECPVNPTRLARRGWYYEGNGDETVCFCCKVKHDHWKPGDDIDAVHARISPNCPFLTGQEAGNVPIHGRGSEKQSNEIEEKDDSDVLTADNVEDEPNVELLDDQKEESNAEHFGLDDFHYDFPDSDDDDKVSVQSAEKYFCKEDLFERTLKVKSGVESRLLINDKKNKDVISSVRKTLTKDSRATDIPANMPSYESQVNRKLFGPESDVPFLNFKTISTEPVCEITNEFRDIHPQLNKASASQKENIDKIKKVENGTTSCKNTSQKPVLRRWRRILNLTSDVVWHSLSGNILPVHNNNENQDCFGRLPDVHQDDREEQTTLTDSSFRPAQMSSEFTTQSSGRSLNSSETSSLSSAATSAVSGLFSLLSSGSNEEALKYEWARFRSFWSFPIECPANPTRLARRGWYYEGHGDETICFCCKVKHAHWRLGEDIDAVHARISPTCLFVTGQEAGNVPIHGLGAVIGSVGEDVAHIHLTRSSSTSNIESVSLCTNVQHQREGTESLPQVPSNPQMQPLASSSSFSGDKDRLRRLSPGGFSPQKDPSPPQSQTATCGQHPANQQQHHPKPRQGIEERQRHVQLQWNKDVQHIQIYEDIWGCENCFRYRASWQVSTCMHKICDVCRESLIHDPRPECPVRTCEILIEEFDMLDYLTSTSETAPSSNSRVVAQPTSIPATFSEICDPSSFQVYQPPQVGVAIPQPHRTQLHLSQQYPTTSRQNIERRQRQIQLRQNKDVRHTRSCKDIWGCENCFRYRASWQVSTCMHKICDICRESLVHEETPECPVTSCEIPIEEFDMLD